MAYDGVNIVAPIDTITYSASYITEFITINPNGTTTMTVTNTSASAAFHSTISMVIDLLGAPGFTKDIAGVSHTQGAL